MTTLTNIAGELRDAGSLDTTGADRRFRDAWAFDGKAVVVDPVMAKPAMEAMVDAERDRRVANAGVVYNGVPVDTRHDADFRNLQALAMEAKVRLDLADTTTFQFRGADNQTHTLTPADMLALARTALGTMQAIYAKSWAIKAALPTTRAGVLAFDASDDSLWA